MTMIYSASLCVQTMRWSACAASFISCCILLLTAWSVVVSGQAVISVVEPLNIVAYRPGQFSLSIRKTGLARIRPVTIIVEVYAFR